jgi:hypothetical protein
MTLQQQIPANAPVSDQSGLFRLRALFSEQQAQESTDSKSKQDWEELARIRPLMSQSGAFT